MCGIVGVVGADNAVNEVLEGLKKLEYRGYDSAGIATLENNDVSLRRSVGKIAALELKLSQDPFQSNANIAIGHTRWATHGEPNEDNAHPHIADNCAVVHNGIIENFITLRDKLEAAGVKFKSQTDSEALPLLISEKMKNHKTNALDAVIQTVKEAKGSFAFGVIFKGNHDVIIAAKRGAPLVIGVGSNGKNYLASDPLALAKFTDKFIFLENNDIAIISPDSIEIVNDKNQKQEREIQQLEMDKSIAGKGEFPHFMLKEIYEQPDVITDTINSYLNGSHDEIVMPAITPELAKNVSQINVIACGTSWHAGLTAKYWIEQLAGISVNVDIASEFRYRKPVLLKNCLNIFISQSGETADSLAALEYVKEQGHKTLALINVPNSNIDRAADISLYTKAGVEIGVASTKAFTTQLVIMLMVALKLGEENGTLSSEALKSHMASLVNLPSKLEDIKGLDAKVKVIAKQVINSESALYLARGVMAPLALEGALKLKEISYIHAEGYATGEMKHGAIALVDDNFPVVLLAPYDELFEKNLSNMQEVEARQGRVILITDKRGAKEAGSNKRRISLVLDDVDNIIEPIYYTIPLQLLAYHIGVLKGTDVDQPRNLAKSVTVE